jgi:hypothetical protein
VVHFYSQFSARNDAFVACKLSAGVLKFFMCDCTWCAVVLIIFF